MSKIQWTGETWNSIVGCSKYDARCRNCYAMGDSPHRFASKYDRDGVVILRGKATREGLTYSPTAIVDMNERKGRRVVRQLTDGRLEVSLGKGAQWTGEVRLLPWALDKPMNRKKPTTYFVNSLGDTFHESVIGCEDGRRFVAALYAVAAACPQHTFQFLTKRDPRPWFEWLEKHPLPRRPVTDDMLDAPDGSIVYGWERAGDQWVLRVPRSSFIINEIGDEMSVEDGIPIALQCCEPSTVWPLPNVWIGSSVEAHAPALREIPVAVRFLSLEPLLEHPGDLDLDGIDWCITGGESGPKSRPCDVAWIRSVRDQCKASGVACFVKQLGARPTLNGQPLALESRKGDNMDEWPEDIRVREMPVTP